MPLSNLNQQQYNSATASLGYNLTIASAGTGKTSTIVGRIAHLLQNNVNPEEILLLTFTNKASAEMINRVAKYFDKETASKIISGTFHSVSFKLLKQLGYKIALKQPKELKTLFRSLYEKRVFSIIDDIKPYDGSYLYDIYSLFLNSTQNESFEDWLSNKNENQKYYIPIYEDVIEEFKKIKKEHGYVNFTTKYA
jgi:DNA helicase-2/ATP-dependent DNA helicase PcrA